MDVRELKIFRSAYESRNFSKTAKDVYMSTQGVSKSIQALETELGTVLFERSNKGVIPTHSADILYRDSVRLINSYENLYRDLNSPYTDQTVHAAFSYGVIAYIGFEKIQQYETENPGITIDYWETDDVSINEQLRNGKADAAVCGIPWEKINEIPLLFSSRHVAVINVQHPLAKKNSVSYKDLDGERIALIGREFVPYHNNLHRLERAGAKPSELIETGEIAYTHLFASQNKGIGISVDFIADSIPPYPDTVIVPFSDKDCTWDVGIRRSEDTSMPVRDDFISYLVSCVAEHENAKKDTND